MTPIESGFEVGLTWAHIEIENYTLKQEEQFYGAAREERLKA